MDRTLSSLSSGSLFLAVALASAMGCSKDNKDAADAAAEAAVVAVDAAADAAADAGVDAADAATTPLPTTAAPTVKPKPKPDPPICTNARAARARNAPTAPSLEAQCRALGGTP